MVFSNKDHIENLEICLHITSSLAKRIIVRISREKLEEEIFVHIKIKFYSKESFADDWFYKVSSTNISSWNNLSSKGSQWEFCHMQNSDYFPQLILELSVNQVCSSRIEVQTFG